MKTSLKVVNFSMGCGDAVFQMATEEKKRGVYIVYRYMPDGKSREERHIKHSVSFFPTLPLAQACYFRQEEHPTPLLCVELESCELWDFVQRTVVEPQRIENSFRRESISVSEVLGDAFIQAILLRDKVSSSCE